MLTVISITLPIFSYLMTVGTVYAYLVSKRSITHDVYPDDVFVATMWPIAIPVMLGMFIMRPKKAKLPKAKAKLL